MSYSTRFSSIAWSQMACNPTEFPYGLVGGGMTDGSIHIWDPARLASNDPDSLLISLTQQHQGAIPGLQFNPHKESSHLLASGGVDAEVFVTSLENLDQPSVFVPAPLPSTAKHSAGITKVAWNTQVSHILASASSNGGTYIWDLKQKKAWCEIRDPTGAVVSDVAWNPEQGLNLVTASGDDKNPVIKLWDLRSSTSLPLATLQGHTEGILSLSWCPNDPTLLLSCGKDNKTILWDLFHLQPVYELPSDNPDENVSPSNAFGGFAGSAGKNKRYHVSWSPCIPAVISASSFDRSVQFYSLSGAKSRIGRAPKWLRRSSGATWGFGGKLACFDNRGPDITDKNVKISRKVQVSQVVEDSNMVHACDAFHATLSTQDYRGFCDMKVASTRSEKDRQVWSLMKVICFDPNARTELVSHLGFNQSSVASAAEKYLYAGAPKPPSPRNMVADSSVSANDIFGAPNIAALSIEPPVPTPILPPASAKIQAEMAATVLKGQEVEPIVRQAIIIGNFSAAVDCCIHAGLWAEALLLAKCGDPSLMIKTETAFFESQKSRYPFLSMLHGIMKQQLMELVLQSNLMEWRQTLAVLSTYGKSEEFAAISSALAGRLENELGDRDSATLCYMCASDVHRTVGYWTEEVKAANAALGYVDTIALQEYVEKVVIFTTANPTPDLGIECKQLFAEYAGLLASQGRLDVASRYLTGASLPEQVLVDRLYNAGSKPAGSRPPPFPFEKVVVNLVVEAKPQPVVQQGKPAGPQGLPQGWLEQFDPNTKRPYYVNTATGQSQWEHPAPVAAPAQQRPTQFQSFQQPHAQPAAAPVQAQQRPTQFQQQQQSFQQQPAAAPVQAQPNPTQFQSFQQPHAQPAAAPVQAQPRPTQFQQQPNQQFQQQQQAFQQQVPQQQQAFQQQVPQQQQAFQQQVPQQQAFQQQVPQQQAFQQQVPQQQAFQQQVPQQQQAFQQQVPQQQQAFQQQQPFQQQQQPVQTPQQQVPQVIGGFGQPLQPVTGVPQPAIPKPVVQAEPVDSGPAIALGTYISQMTEIANPLEKRQLAMVSTAYNNLLEKINTNEVSADVMNKIAQLVSELNSRNFVAANAIQTNLANTEWNLHKEWIKGVKILIQLASKK